MRRRQAVGKINSLKEATPQQLEEFDDVCAICYQELTTARITRCNHYFHGVCLRKWLYVQDICPLCHEVLCADPDNNSNGSRTNHENRQVREEDDPSRDDDDERRAGARDPLNGLDWDLVDRVQEVMNQLRNEDLEDQSTEIGGNPQNVMRENTEDSQQSNLQTSNSVRHET